MKDLDAALVTMVMVVMKEDSCSWLRPPVKFWDGENCKEQNC